MTKQQMSKEAAARIQSAAARHPESATGRTDFAPRAQSAADRHEPGNGDQDDDDE